VTCSVLDGATVRRQPVESDRTLRAAGSTAGFSASESSTSFMTASTARSFKIKYTGVDILQGFVSHALLVGLPIAWFWHRFDFNPSLRAPNAA
jgi:hypothetical protein